MGTPAAQFAPKSATVRITGTASVGSTLTASVTPSTFTASAWQWYRSTDNGVTWSSISGATSSTYTLQAADDGCKINAVATLTSTGTSQGLIVAYAAPVVVSAPVINGSPSVGTPISVTPAVFGGGTSTVSTQVYLDNALIVGAGLTYTPISSDVGHTLYVTQTASNDGGSVSATSAGAVVINDPYMIAANRLYLPNTRQQATTASLQYQAFSVVMTTPPYPITSPRFVFPNFVIQTAQGEVATGNAYPFESFWLETTIGTTGTQLTVGGATSGSIPDGGYVITDELPGVTIPANTQIRIRGAMGPVPLNGYYPTGSYQVQQGVYEANTTNSASRATLVSTAWPTTPASYSPGTTPYGPCLMVAKGWAAAGQPPVVLVVGDSIAWGSGDYDGVIAPDGVFGYVGRGLNSTTGGRVPFANFAIPGTRYSGLADTNTTDSQSGFALRRAMLSALNWPYSTILCEMGINSVTNPQGSGTAAQIAWLQSQAQSAWTYLKSLGNKRVVQTLMTPQSTSNVNTGAASPGAANYLDWTTNNVGDQFPNSATLHAALDSYITSGTPVNLDGYIDIRPYAQIDNSGGYQLFKLPASCISATLQASASSGQKVISLDVAPAVGDCLTINAGNSTVVTAQYVASVTGSASPYTVTLKGNLASTWAAGTTVKGSSTADGTHPAQQVTRVLATPIAAAKGVQIL